jgi:hypothetical protein
MLPLSYIRPNKLSTVCLNIPHNIESKTQISFLFPYISFLVVLLRHRRRRRRHLHRHHHHHHHLYHHYTNARHHLHKPVMVP